jgi:hypothetical protein
MKKHILLLVCCYIFAASALSQPPVVSENLITTFAAIYRDTDKKDNFFGRLTTTSQIFFSAQNKDLLNAVVQTAKQRKIGIDSATFLLFDSTLIIFAGRSYLMEDYPDVVNKYLPYFLVYNEKMCACITTKINVSKNNFIDENAANECVGILAADAGFINSVRNSMGNLTLAQMAELGPPSGIYLYQRCPALARYFNYIIGNDALSSFDYEVRQMVLYADTALAGHYKRNDISSLASAFPTYRSSLTAIKELGVMLGQPGLSIRVREKENLNGSTEVVKTFYSYPDDVHPVLHGQTIMVLSDKFPRSPILSFSFVQPGKIKDRKQLLKELEEDNFLVTPPPPPQEELIKEVRIDTLKRKN